MTTEHTGCNPQLIKLLAAIMWLTVIATAILGFAVEMWIGYTFVGVVVITHIIVAIVAKYKAKLSIILIPKEFYNQVTKVVEDLYADYEKVLKIQDSDDTDDPIDVRRLFLADITRCYSGLGLPIDFNTKEGLGWLYFFALTKGCEHGQNYANRAQLIATYQQNAENEIPGIQIQTNSNPSTSDIFEVSEFLLEYDTELRMKFLVDIYRFASIAAKADNTVTNKEAEWLSSILTLQEHKTEEVVPENVEDVEDVEEDEIKLDELIGLESVKKEVETMTNFIRIQQERAAKGLKPSPVSYHCVFTGNPGTGKTTVARILARIYKHLGVVSSGHLVETDRSGLVAEYIGQTAAKTNAIIDSALDGILFIDEAYSLIDGGANDYGQEAIATLVKRMEDNRDRLIVILAGYTDEMKDFIDSNPGLQSRFRHFIDFPDYSAEQLVQIFEANMKRYDYCFDDGAKQQLMQIIQKAVAKKDNNFGNGRWVRNLFERTLEQQANRLARVPNLTTDILSTITTEDIPLTTETI